MKVFDWPVKSPVEIYPAIAALAPPNLSVIGRTVAQRGRLGWMNSAGTGKIKLGWNRGPFLVKSEKVRPLSETGPLRPAKSNVPSSEGFTAFPAKSIHSRK